MNWVRLRLPVSGGRSIMKERGKETKRKKSSNGEKGTPPPTRPPLPPPPSTAPPFGGLHLYKVRSAHSTRHSLIPVTVAASRATTTPVLPFHNNNNNATTLYLCARSLITESAIVVTE